MHTVTVYCLVTDLQPLLFLKDIYEQLDCAMSHNDICIFLFADGKMPIIYMRSRHEVRVVIIVYDKKYVLSSSCFPYNMYNSPCAFCLSIPQIYAFWFDFIVRMG
jgi:hypothetical protein